MTAPTDKLNNLHSRLADAMSDALDAEVNRIRRTDALLEADLSELDEDTAKALSNVLSLAPTARVDNGLLKTVAGFLKDNSITADLSGGDDADETAAKLEELHKRRRVVSTPLDNDPRMN